MLARNCKGCDYFCDSGHTIGTCRRFPLFQTRSPNEWCGEFTPVPYSEPVPDMLALPVREMTDEPKVKRKYTKKVTA